MTINQISDKFFELLKLYAKELGVTNADTVRSICDNILNSKSSKMIIKINLIKNQLFDDMADICNDIKLEFMKLPELKNISISKFNEANKILPKLIVRLSDACTKIPFTFIVDIDSNNEEYLQVYKKDTNSLLYTFTGTGFRNLISNIIKSLNNDKFINPERSEEFSVYSYVTSKDDKVIIELNLADMIDIINYYTMVINSKYSKVLHKEFKFRIDQMDIDIPKDQSQKRNNSYSTIIQNHQSNIDDDNIEFIKLNDFKSK